TWFGYSHLSLSIGGEVYEGTNQWIEELKLENRRCKSIQGSSEPAASPVSPFLMSLAKAYTYRNCFYNRYGTQWSYFTNNISWIYWCCTLAQMLFIAKKGIPLNERERVECSDRTRDRSELTVAENRCNEESWE
ncbi:hypothetical protein Tco_1571710, partial [Tanacetum coccineum]